MFKLHFIISAAALVVFKSLRITNKYRNNSNIGLVNVKITLCLVLELYNNA